MSKKRLAISILGLAVVLGPAWGDTCTTASNPCTESTASGSDSTDRTIFESDTLNTAAAMAFTMISFDSITAGNYSSAGLTTDGVTFTGTDANGADLHVGTFAGWSDNQILMVQNSNDTITITLPSNVFAFDLDLLITSGSGSLPFLISYNNGSVVNDSSVNAVLLPGSVFYGVTSATAITSITISPTFPSEAMGIDNFDFGQASPTPEAGTLLLIGAGLILMRLMNRRQRRHSLKSRAVEQSAKPGLPLPLSF